MKFHKNKLLTIGSAAALAFAVAACSSNGDDETAAAVAPPPATTEPAPEPTPVVTSAGQLKAAQGALVMAQGLVHALTSTSTAEEAAVAYAALGAAQVALHAATNLPANQLAALQAQIDQLVLDLEAANSTPSTETVALEQAQADAATAAAAAATAATAAKTASDAALAARENRAVIQTGDLSGGNSGMLAHAAYMYAKAAADAAKDAQDASDAAAAATDVTTAARALVMAETARDNAVTAQGMAEAQRDAAVLAAASEVKIVDKTKTVGDTSITVGVDDTREVTTVDATTRTGKEDDITLKSKKVAGVPAVDAAAADPPTAAVAAVAGKPGVTAGRPINIGFVYDSADDSARVALVHSYIGSTAVGAYSDSRGETRMATDGMYEDGGVMRPIKAATGTYYLAKDVTDALESGNIEVATTEGDSLYYYSTTSEPVEGVTTTTKTFLRRTDTAIEEDTTLETFGQVTHMYQVVVTRTGVLLPEATEYAHHHYGIWADLKEAAKTGDNALATLGVGFVAGLSEMTGDDMPNHGKADYSGGWIAHVQAADPEGNGPIEMMATGDSSMEALFEKGTVSVGLTGLASFAGTIDGNTFSGDKAPTAVDHTSLTEDGEFTGSFSGAFFGPNAKEAGGVFDYSSEDNEDGAFRGAFGGVR